MLFGGSDGGPQGPRWIRHSLMPQVRGVERKKGAFGSFERVLLFLTLLESGYGKYDHFGGKYCCLRALMGVPRVPDGQYMAPCHE